MRHLDQGSATLGLPALASPLFRDSATPDLNAAALANQHLLDAIRSLAVIQDGKTRRHIDYRNLGSDELGSVYEHLLELHPEISGEAFELRSAAGNERKKTGSYYTPASLIACLLDSALDPVIDEAAGQPNPEQAILKLKIVDPACGSGHFLIAAAHRLAKRLAAVRTGEPEPSPTATQTALRDVIGHCVYGVDLNPMAVELCKVSLWMEALEPGKPLSFLESKIRHGHSLLGTTPALMADGIPDDALSPIAGDDAEIAKRFKKENKKERLGQSKLFTATIDPWNRLGNFPAAVTQLDAMPDDSPEAIAEKERRWEEAVRGADYLDATLLADTWCAAFVFPKTKQFSYPITEEVFRRVERNPHSIDPWMRDEIRRIAGQYGFFHWHLALPDVFGADGEGGFDAVLGNPPWERIKLQEKEWFAERRPDIAAAANAASRRKMIAALKTEDPALFQGFEEALRQADGESALIRNSGRYPLCGVGDINTYAIFAESDRNLLSKRGRLGVIVPSGIATDNTTKDFFASMVETHTLVSLYDFENREGIFEGVHRSYKFSLMTVAGSSRPAGAATDFFCFALSTADLSDPDRHFTLTAEEIALINPNTRTCPIFRTKRDAEITKSIYRRVPILAKEGPPEENPWGIRFMRMFDMSNDSHLFLSEPGEDRVPLYEAKMMHHYTHRYGDYAMRPDGSQDTELPRIPASRLDDPNYAVTPRYWVRRADLPDLVGRQWLLGFRDIARATDERTAIFSVLPPVAANHKTPLIFPREPVAAFVANVNSLAFDYVARQNVGGTSLGFFILKQLAVLPASEYDPAALKLITSRVLELTYTAWDLAGFAKDLNYVGPPFRWNEDRRFQLRCELDALYFHLYGLNREDTDYILDTFPIVRRNDEKKFGEYRTKRAILEIYDRMAANDFASPLDPPAADVRAAHSTKIAPSR